MAQLPVSVSNRIEIFDKIKNLGKTGLHYRCKSVTPLLSDRLSYELNVIESINASAYFLLLCDILKHVNHLGFNHFCPGNANASLVCYCLGLTNIDPIEHDLLFESFIIPGQKHLPDFNLEFDSTEKLQATKAILEKFGLSKLGPVSLVISGRKNLKLQIDTINRIQKKHKVKINPWKLPLDDKKNWAYFQKKEKSRPICFNDLLAIVSLSNQKSDKEIKQYFLNKANPEKISYPHPVLQNVLQGTKGILMFQEQILRILQLIGGFTQEEAEDLRKALEYKDKKVIEKQAAVFLVNALRRKIAKRKAMAIFSKMKKLAPYALYKAEAVAEAYFIFQGAFLKVHYPKEIISRNQNK
jgi:DNA polymerase III alpha subunit